MTRLTSRIFIATTCLLIVPFLSSVPMSLPGFGSVSAQASPQQLQTPAERVNYSQGGTLYGPLMEFVY